MLKQAAVKMLGLAVLGLSLTGCGVNAGLPQVGNSLSAVRATSQVTGVKRGLMVGINAYQHVNGLRGCINDINDVKAQIAKQGFTGANIVTLADAQATRANILSNLSAMVAASKPGDFLYFHYSGHGAQIPDTNGDEPDGQDEILCPVDLTFSGSTITNAVVDDEIQTILGQLKPGVGFLFVSDSCHSGSIDDSTNRGVRGISLPANTRNLTPMIYDRASQNTFKARVAEKKYTLLSGCQDDQTSADAYINNRYCGALTHYFLEALNAGGLKQTYAQLHAATLAGLTKNNYEQRPALVGASTIPLFTIAD